MQKIIITMVLALSSYTFAADLPAYIHLSFKTTLTVEKTTNSAVLATAFVFPMDKQMYSSLDGPWDPVACDTNTGCVGCNKATNLSSFNLTDLKLSDPAVNIPTTARLSVLLGYKERPEDTTKILLTASNITPVQFSSGSFTTTKTPEFSIFSNAIKSDILTAKCRRSTRRFNSIYFVVKLELTGLTTTQLAAIARRDLTLEIKANAETTINL